MLQSVDVLAESETGVGLTDRSVLLAVELGEIAPLVEVACGWMTNGHTSLTGIDDTPISIAMNQHALAPK